MTEGKREIPCIKSKRQNKSTIVHGVPIHTEILHPVYHTPKMDASPKLTTDDTHGKTRSSRTKRFTGILPEQN